MTDDEAKARCLELASTSPDRETHIWIPRRAGSGDWSVIRLAIPPSAPPQGTSSKSADFKGILDDPRNALEQNIPPHGIGL